VNKRDLLLIGFVLLTAAQLAVPAWMIISREHTVTAGQTFKFRTQPVDPADAFRGRYVWLALEPNSFQTPNPSMWRYGQKAYAVLETGADGFAVVKRLDQAMPANETAVRVRISWPDLTEGVVHFDWQGLDRLYMSEDKAPKAEEAYRRHSRRGKQSCHVTVRVLGKQAVIENLFINGKPIGEWLLEDGSR
jgi:uncharacterized membrane-anchored protein